jgi:hypothetical protein
MAVLDDRPGFEFEDVIMEEVVDGQRRAIIVEYKHTDTAGRPVVQKLHSAIACDSHIKPERLKQEPIYTDCAVTERFALKTKYFYDDSGSTSRHTIRS